MIWSHFGGPVSKLNFSSIGIGIIAYYQATPASPGGQKPSTRGRWRWLLGCFNTDPYTTNFRGPSKSSAKKDSKSF